MVDLLTSSISTIPLSLRDCLVNGEVDIHRYWIYKRRKQRKINNLHILDSIVKNARKRTNIQLESQPIYERTPRSVKRHKLLYRDDNGELKEYTTSLTLWYLLYVNQEPRNNCQRKLFRSRFRMPHTSFLELAHDLSNHDFFGRWTSQDASNQNSSNIKLLLLGSLRYIGRGWTFDDIEEATCISRECHRQFFKVFVQYGSTVLYNIHVTLPALNTDPSEFEKLFIEAGFNGCLGSSDATHVRMLSCSVWAQINHLGHKLKIPSRTYNATVTHCRQILGSTSGHPDTWNDKTIILYDELIRGVHEGKLFHDYNFSLLEYDTAGEVIEIEYQGAWFMVDNGYLAWSTTIPPMKHAVTYKCIRFSEWLESMRKDVECTFGILKGCFCILRYGIRTNSIERCDEIWKTCCALHNMLLFIDGLDKNWESGASSNWEKINSSYQKRNNGKFAINRLNNPSFGCKEKNTVKHNDYNLDEFVVNNKRIVRKMPIDIFQQKLIEHFDIRFNKNSIKWPSRCKSKPII